MHKGTKTWRNCQNGGPNKTGGLNYWLVNDSCDVWGKVFIPLEDFETIIMFEWFYVVDPSSDRMDLWTSVPHFHLDSGLDFDLSCSIRALTVDPTGM